MHKHSHLPVSYYVAACLLNLIWCSVKYIDNLETVATFGMSLARRKVKWWEILHIHHTYHLHTTHCEIPHNSVVILFEAVKALLTSSLSDRLIIAVLGNA